MFGQKLWIFRSWEELKKLVKIRLLFSNYSLLYKRRENKNSFLLGSVPSKKSNKIMVYCCFGVKKHVIFLKSLRTVKEKILQPKKYRLNVCLLKSMAFKNNIWPNIFIITVSQCLPLLTKNCNFRWKWTGIRSAMYF